MKRGEIVEGKVISVSFPNKGIVETAEGDKLRVKGVIPGQRVKVRVKKSSKEKAQGMLLELLEKSPIEKAEPFCPHYGSCGGCCYQTLDYDKQLELKSSMIKQLLAPVIGEEKFDKIFEGVKASPKQFEYRNKMEFSFGDEFKDGPLSLGLHKKGSFYDVVTVENCQNIDEDMRKVLRVTLDYFKKSNQTFYKKNSHEGYLRYLLVRKAAKTGEILVDLVTSTQISYIYEIALLEGWKQALLSEEYAGKIAGILHTKDDKESDAVYDEGTEIIYGKSFFTEQLLDLSFTISPFSFFQTNSLGAEVLYSTAREFISEKADDAEVYDLYSGTGTIAQIIAPAAKHVTGVEIIEEAVEAAKENGIDIPAPVIEENEYSGKFIVRVSPLVHRDAVENAKRQGLSLNQYVGNAIIAMNTATSAADIAKSAMHGLGTRSSFHSSGSPSYVSDQISLDYKTK